MRAGDLRVLERRIFSQNGEDGILEEILRRVGVETKYFVEFGVETGSECNCARFVFEEHWHGLFIEGDPTSFTRLRDRYRPREGVRCIHAWVTSQNIEDILAASDVPRNFDVLSIDIDGNDYWVWSAIRRWTPRVVVIEYNASYPPPRKWIMKENPNHHWDGTNYFGASLASLAGLGKEKGYVLVATNSSGVSAFFVREDLVTNEKFLNPGVVDYLYSPPRYGPHRGGHPPRKGWMNSWMKRVSKATAEVAALMPVGDSLILVDQDEWGTDEIVAGSRQIPFLERDGQYWGPPSDDETAIREFERLRASGANFMVFAWPAFWWLDYYSGLNRHLRSHFRCVLENERLVVFDLRSHAQ